jgi:transposase InsO family protein
VLDQTGPRLPLAALRGAFPHVTRAELWRLLSRYRRVARRRKDQQTACLTWHVAGAVWAIDFLKPPNPVDGVAPAVLAVRDLASGYQLLWHPFENETAAVTCGALEDLFGQWGPPLVLKADNGSAFIAEATAELLNRWQVTPLFSPPRNPQYNGGCERGNGTLRTFTDEAALMDDRPSVWISQDLQRAVDIHNELLRPKRLAGATPAQVWQQRPALSAEERQQFLDCVEACRQQVLATWDRAAAVDLSRSGRAALDRLAVRDALCGLGYLTIHRRRPPDRARFRLLAAAPPTLRTSPTPSAPVVNPPPVQTNRSLPHLSPGTIPSVSPARDSTSEPPDDPAAAPKRCGVIDHLRRLITLVFPRRKAADIP